MQKSKAEAVSKTQMLSWINRALNINQTRIQNLGSGVIYCLLLNHYYPGAIQPSKIIMIPRNHNDYRTNLRRLQQGLSTQDIRVISFDVFKVAEMTYAENWSLICKFHKLLHGIDKQKNIENGKETKQLWWSSKGNQNKSQSNFNQNNFSFNSNPMTNNPMSTPVKGSKFLEEGKCRWQSMNLIEQIKRIVIVQTTNDRVKVGQLRRLLGLQQEQGHECEVELRDLLSDYKKKQEIIQID